MLNPPQPAQRGPGRDSVRDRDRHLNTVAALTSVATIVTLTAVGAATGAMAREASANETSAATSNAATIPAATPSATVAGETTGTHADVACEVIELRTRPTRREVITKVVTAPPSAIVGGGTASATRPRAVTSQAAAPRAAQPAPAAPRPAPVAPRPAPAAPPPAAPQPPAPTTGS